MMIVEFYDGAAIMEKGRNDSIRIEFKILWFELIAALKIQHFAVPRQGFFVQR